ncbi:hypothetical protein [Oceanisphaera pacifica]|uniref:Uncharacterized protein n=1 Tax=Oceanisphaera pacifica TaxID=2818389 RepID=A0ABS3NG05_9GAMM|nr:hypothetical protein [Oceanisphaera pacifica]MBO1519470.1 hypothetical protein [Oceanisphaera pacifica]
MDITISVSNAVARWLSLSLPRLPSADGKRIGTQALTTNFNQLAWQCHLLEHGPASNPYHTVVAMEAYSRYVMFLPFATPPSQAELEQTLLERWGNEALHLAIESGAITDNELPLMVDNFSHQHNDILWVNNYDASINGHISDARAWFMQALIDEDRHYLDGDTCYGLARHINQLYKKVGGSKGRFRPIVRLLDDALFRFGSGLSVNAYPNTKVGDFPCPYPAPKLPSNVVNFSDYKK